MSYIEPLTSEIDRRRVDWCVKNADRIKELTDRLDACSSLIDKQKVYAQFTPDEKDGIIDEYGRRKANRLALPGSLVAPVGERFNITVHITGGTLRASHAGVAIVIGADDGTYNRYVFLMPEWVDAEGRTIRFAYANAAEFKIVDDNYHCSAHSRMI